MLSARKKLSINTITSIILQITTVICGFVLPRLILGQYGSAINGLVSSITQFLSLITFLELGLGAVIPSALYKPLAEKNENEISAIITSGSRFFKRIAIVLAVYVAVLIAVYPTFVNKEFDWAFTSLLIVTISISSFAQYYFGIIDSLLLIADQNGYIQYTSQIVTLILNTVVCAVLIRTGATIHCVKGVASVIFFIRPLALRIYVNKHYRIDRRYHYEREPIKQKWNGVAQHVAYVVLNDTDTIVLTLLSTLSNVSIYAVYNMVVIGVKNLLISSISGIQALIGELWAKQMKATLDRLFAAVEFSLHTAVVFVFTCTGILIVPFIQVYTSGITDANYIRPAFAILITIAHAIHCLRLPYNIMIIAAGHYKQTQMNYIISAIVNIVVSVVLVWQYDLIGVAIGTIVAMLYQTVWLSIYNSRHLLDCPIRNFFKQFLFDIVLAGLIVLATSWIKLESISYISWVVMACKVVGIAALIIVGMSLLLYREQVKYIWSHFLSK